jgi:hypothetical protein
MPDYPHACTTPSAAVLTRRSRCALGMLGFVAQDATHPRWALDIVTKGWPLTFGTVAAAMPKGERASLQTLIGNIVR